MRVTAWKTVEVECEVDVEISDVLASMKDTAEHGTDREKVRAIDSATKVLELIGCDPLAIVKADHDKIADGILQRIGPLIEWCNQHKGSDN